MGFIIFLIVVGFIVYRLIKSYRLNTFDTVVAFTGGLGSGKSFLSVDTALRLLKKQRRRVRAYNFFHPFKKEPLPLLYSSIPVKISNREMAVILTEKHLTEQEQIVPRSVLLLDEIGGFCSQFDYKAQNADIFDDFVRFFRHYTLGGYIVCNDQCSENIVLQVRRRLNTVYNLMGFRKWFGLFYTVKVRNISVSEEIKTVEENNTEDNMRTLFGILPLSRRYDTYCYSNRYNYVEKTENKKHKGYKMLIPIRLPKAKLVHLDEKIKSQEKALDKNAPPC